MDQRRWEDLNMDCLTYIFGKLGMESLLLDVPLVCKSWYRASLDPSCWVCLIFQEIETSYFGFPVETENWRSVPLLQRFVDEYQIDESRFSVTAFIKFVANRSRSHAFVLMLPSCASETALKYVSDVCGNLKGVALLRNLVNHKSSVILELIGKWKHLESLILGSTHRLEEILSQISIHCKDFSALYLGNANIGKDEAMAVVSFLPKIKSLLLSKTEIGPDALMTLIRGCKELQVLDVCDCVGFSEGDDEISKLASHISGFSCKGSRVYDDDDFYEGISFMFDETVHDGYNSN